jgi:uncharacterized protein (TIGR02302 family)
MPPASGRPLRNSVEKGVTISISPAATTIHRRAHRVLCAEQLLTRLWPLLLMLTAVLLLALAGVFALLPVGLHVLLLLALAAGGVWHVVRVCRTLPRLPVAALERRIEAASQLPHQPYIALADHLVPARDDALTHGLWQLHQEQARLALARPLHTGWPRLPDGLRHSVPLMVTSLLVAVLSIGGQAGPRLRAALWPEVHVAGLTSAPALQAWLEPPAYTGLPLVSLPVARASKRDFSSQSPAPAASTAAAPLRVPAGSTLRLVLPESHLHPRLHLPPRTAPADTASHTASGGSATGPHVIPLQRLAATQNGYALSLPLHAAGLYRLQTGFLTVAAWSVAPVADAPPRLTRTDAPEPEPQGTLRIGYQAEDDYGVVSLWAVVKQAVVRRAGGNIPNAVPDHSPDSSSDSPADPSDTQVRILLQDTPATNRQPTLSGTAVLDLTAHPWAGSQVTLQLEAVDATGQSGVSVPVMVTLPERPFTHPVARQLAALRKALMQNFPQSFEPVAGELAQILSLPDDLDGDLTAYLALRVAYNRLLLTADSAAVSPSVPVLLWETALRLEEHTPAGADARLQQAEDALRQALANPNSTPAALEQAFRDLAEALQETLNHLQDAAAFLPPDQAPDFGADMTDSLNDLLQTLRQQALSGNRQQAQQALEAIQKLTEALRQAQKDPERNREAMAAMGELAKLAGEQSALAEAVPGTADKDLPKQGKAQEGLRQRLHALGQTLDRLGLPKPETLNEAGEAMAQAGAALQGKQPQRTLATQQAGRAADLLAQGMEQMLQSLQQGGSQLLSLGGRQGGNGAIARDRIAVPDDARTRLRQILETLRSRANDSARPAEEREYLRRLLEAF